MCICVYVCMCICVNVYMCICVYIHIDIYFYMYIYIYIVFSLSLYIYIYIVIIYIYICIHMDIHIWGWWYRWLLSLRVPDASEPSRLRAVLDASGIEKTRAACLSSGTRPRRNRRAATSSLHRAATGPVSLARVPRSSPLPGDEGVVRPCRVAQRGWGDSGVRLETILNFEGLASFRHRKVILYYII